MLFRSLGLYLAVISAIGYLADSPSYRYTAADKAELKVFVRFSGVRLGDCRQFSAEEVASMPANMKRPAECPREKSPVRFRLHINEELLIDQTLKPAGIHDDGVISFYERHVLDPGVWQLAVAVDTDIQREGYEDTFFRVIRTEVQNSIVIGFNDDGFRVMGDRNLTPVAEDQAHE